jgi:tripartite-type tricarboxylate transporter receptor subunit TctC
MSRLAVFVLASSTLVAMHATAQGCPVKPVRVVVPITPGGPNDLVLRPLSQKLHGMLGQPFVLDYRPGGSAIIGTDYMAKAPPDGYTLLIISSTFTINTATFAKLPYDAIRDFAAVSSIATGDILLVVNLVVPARTVAEFITRLNAAMVKALAAADVCERYAAIGMETVTSTPQEYADHLRSEMVKLRKVVAAAKLPLL